ELSLETGAVPGAVGGTGRLSRLERPDLAASGRGRLRGRPPAAVLALGAIAAALAAVAGVLSARVGDLDGQVGNLDRQVAQVTAALSKSSVGAAALAASLDPRNPRIELGPASSSVSPPSAQLIVDRASGTAFFVARSLHPLRGGRTYQLWSLVRGEPVSVGLLGSSPSSSEPAQVLVASNMSTFMVTAEPEGGTPRPTTPVLIEGTLPAAS
ncbi:MAG TPA: anti-sigma factor, partial [Acidimicrobiales bacterium]|nr:anti-sigma factor [Acidimicrobiales bacterium]